MTYKVKRATDYVMGDSKSFRGPNGTLTCKALFIDNYASNQWEVITVRPYWTLKDDDVVFNGETYPSLKKIYLEHNDITEYNFAMALFGSYEHWQMICNSKWMKKHIHTWRTELKAKLSSEMHQIVVEIATDKTASPSSRLAAAKFKLQEEWREEDPTARRMKMRKVTDDEATEAIKNWTGPTLSDITRTKH